MNHLFATLGNKVSKTASLVGVAMFATLMVTATPSMALAATPSPEITVVPNQNPVFPGAEIRYNVTVSNKSADTAITGATLKVMAHDAQATIVSAGLPNFVRGAEDSKPFLMWANVTVQPQAAFTFDVVIKLNDNLGAGSTFQTTAWLFGGNVTVIDVWTNVINIIAVPTPTPTPTPTPSSTPEPTPTPKPEEKKEIEVVKTDHRDITRPGHSLTYVISVTNHGNIDMHDVKVTDKVPGQLTVTAIGNNGKQNGSSIVWNIELGAGEVKQLTFKATVKDNTPNNHVLNNTVIARSEDHDVQDDAADTTLVKHGAKVAAAVTPVAVPITAKTGAGAVVAILTTLSGAAGLAVTLRKQA